MNTYAATSPMRFLLVLVSLAFAALSACSEDVAVRPRTTYGDWAALPASANIPTLRIAPSYGVSGNKIVVIGGYSPYPVSIGLVEVFDTTTETWTTPAATLPNPRGGAIEGVHNGKMYISAGYIDGGNYPLDTQEYNIAAQTFDNCAASLAGSPCANITPGNLGLGAEQAASVTYNGKIYTFGGKVNLSFVDDAVREYDIGANSWTDCTGGCAPVPVGPTWVGDAVAIGGMAYYIHPFTNDLLEYDIPNNSWSNCGTVAPGNNCPAVPATPSTTVLTAEMHGRIYALQENTTVLFEYSPTSNTWTNCGTPAPGNGCPVLPGAASRIEAVGNKLYGFDQASGTVYKAIITP